MSLNVKIKKLHPDAIIPTYGTEGAAAFDLYSTESKFITSSSKESVGTGLSFDIPPGYAMIIKPRSGLAFNHSIEAFSGTIDSDYRGEVKVLLTLAACCDSTTLKKGSRIAQAIIIPIPKIEFEAVEELSETARGNNGFGSTGE